MKELFEDFYYLLFPRDEEGVWKTDTDSPLWVKIMIVSIIAFMCFILIIIS